VTREDTTVSHSAGHPGEPHLALAEQSDLADRAGGQEHATAAEEPEPDEPEPDEPDGRFRGESPEGDPGDDEYMPL
jgi:hypothetical protein